MPDRLAVDYAGHQVDKNGDRSRKLVKLRTLSLDGGTKPTLARRAAAVTAHQLQ